LRSHGKFIGPLKRLFIVIRVGIRIDTEILATLTPRALCEDSLEDILARCAAGLQPILFVFADIPAPMSLAATHAFSATWCRFNTDLPIQIVFNNLIRAQFWDSSLELVFPVCRRSRLCGACIEGGVG